MVVISVYIHGVEIIKNFRWESGFLRGVPWTPWALMEVKVPWSLFSMFSLPTNIICSTNCKHFSNKFFFVLFCFVFLIQPCLPSRNPTTNNNNNNKHTIDIGEEKDLL